MTILHALHDLWTAELGTDAWYEAVGLLCVVWEAYEEVDEEIKRRIREVKAEREKQRKTRGWIGARQPRTLRLKGAGDENGYCNCVAR